MAVPSCPRSKFDLGLCVLHAVLCYLNHVLMGHDISICPPALLRQVEANMGIPLVAMYFSCDVLAICHCHRRFDQEQCSFRLKAIRFASHLRNHGVRMTSLYIILNIWSQYFVGNTIRPNWFGVHQPRSIRQVSCCVWYTWWRQQMETFSALLAIWAGISPVTGEFPAQKPATPSFDISFDLLLDKRLSEHWWGWWFKTPSHPLWRHINDIVDWCSHLSLPP